MFAGMEPRSWYIAAIRVENHIRVRMKRSFFCFCLLMIFS